MKRLCIILLIPLATFAQRFQMNDPNPSSPIITEINFQVDRYYPVFGNSEKPFSNEKMLKLTDTEGIYTAYLHFTNNYTPPRYESKTRILHLYYPDSNYDYILRYLKDDDGFILYRDYKDGHKWGEIYFNKYP